MRVRWIRINAVFGALKLLLSGLSANAFIFCNRLGFRVAAIVIKMNATATVSDLPGFQSQIYQALAKLTILSAVLHTFVEAVGFKHIFFPGGRAVSIPGCAGKRDRVENCTEQCVRK